MKRSKGFTLIELLAVIVILAIIALIATPLVLKYIEKSRKESKVDSAYSFVRNLETEIANYAIKNNGKKYNKAPIGGDYYEFEDFDNDKKIDTTVKGDKPNSIKVCLSSLGQVEKGIFEYNDGKYYVSYDGKKGSISDKDTYDNFSCSDNVGNKTKTLCTLADGSTANTIGAKYSCDFGAGAKNFYILELGTNPVSNTTLESDEVALILEGNYDTTTQYWCDQSGANSSNNVCAADGLTSKLDEIAGAWTKLERDQIGLPSMEQIMLADGQSEDAYTDWPLLSNAWLYNGPDNADYGSSAPYGYWSSSPDVDDSSSAWYVDYGGYVGNGGVSYGDHFGVRPVITLKI